MALEIFELQSHLYTFEDVFPIIVCIHLKNHSRKTVKNKIIYYISK